MLSINDAVSGITPVNAARDTITIGDRELDVFQLPDGTHRISITSAGSSIGGSDQFNWLVKPNIKRLIGLGPDVQNHSELLQLNDSQPWADGNSIILPVMAPGLSKPALTINCSLYQAFVMEVAFTSRVYAPQARSLMSIMMVSSLERMCQEKFRKPEDVQSLTDITAELAIRLDADRYKAVLGGEFFRQFKRITGMTFYSRHSGAQLKMLLHGRLPKEVQEWMDVVNPIDPQTGRRPATYHQHLTEEMQQEFCRIRDIILSHMFFCPDYDPELSGTRKSHFATLCRQLDKVLPRQYESKRGRYQRKPVLPAAV